MNANRSFLKKVLAAGVDCGEIEPIDLLTHVTPQVLAHHLPVELKAKLLAASLDAREMTHELVVEVVGIDALTEHSPVGALWACVREAIEARLEEPSDTASDAPSEAASSKKASKRRAPAGQGDDEAPAEPAEGVGAKKASRAAGAGAVSRSRGRRSRASTDFDPPGDEDDEVPRKPNRSAQPGDQETPEPETTVPEGARVTAVEGSAEEADGDDEPYEVEFDEAIDELVADEPSSFEDVSSLFDIDTKVGGPTAPPGEITDDDTSPGAKRRGEG